MALTAVHLSDVPTLDHVPETALTPSRLQSRGPDSLHFGLKGGKFLVVGHRGKGMNALASSDRRMKLFKENSIRSFNEAARFPVDFVEFDVQVTKDGYPIVFHDNFILTEENGCAHEKRVTELHLEEFLSYGPQKDLSKMGKSLHRKLKDGSVFSWNVEEDDSLCTLQEVFEHVHPRLGFNIELKFDDHIVYCEDEITHTLKLILRVVSEHAKDRPIIFSSFQPDAALLMRKLQDNHPVFFLTNGGNETYIDHRRNSLEEAMKLCIANGLHGIVSEVKGVFRNPSVVPLIKESNISLLTYGQLNNVPEAVYMQHLMGINGVIVDLVEEITEAVSDFVEPTIGGDENLFVSERKVAPERPEFSQRELAFLLKLIPELVQH